MIVQYVSDLHLDCFGSEKVIEMVRNEFDADVLCIAGDTAHGFYYGKYGHKDKKVEAFIRKKVKKAFDYFNKNWKCVIVGFGNHDFYHGNIPDGYFGHTIDVRGTKFITTPLFSNIPESKWMYEELKTYKFPDIVWIRSNFNADEPITCKEYVEYHNKCLEWLDSQLSSLDGRCVVMTHHLPAIESISLKYIGDKSNHFFASDLSWLLEKHSKKISHWVHGHSHDEIEVSVHGVKVIRSPIGYLGHGEGSRYRNRCFEV